MSDRRPIRDRHASSHWRPSCLIRDWYALSETGMPHHRKPTCLIGDRYDSSEIEMPHQRPPCLIGDPHASSKTNMPDRRPIKDWHAWSCMYYGYPMRHVCLQLSILISNEAYRSLIRHVGLWSDMSGLQWVLNGSPKIYNIFVNTGKSTFINLKIQNR